ncbi:MAG: 8-amino-7-oxononanoate synthase, partial [Myxococcota bacterium]
EASPIVRIRIGDPAKAVVAWNLAIERGVYVNLVLPPACRRGAEGLRVSVSAAHDLEQLDRSAAILVGAVEDACA